MSLPLRNFPPSPRKLVSLAGLAIIIALIIFFWLRQSKPSGKDEMQKVRDKVSRLAILPKGEDPTLATVQDKQKLSDSFLKANSDNGDKILVYFKAKRVYIYRPSVNRLVNIGPLQVDASADEVNGARILVRTGNGNTGTAETVLVKLKDNYKSAKFGTIAPAARQDYPSTIVIDLTEGDKYDLVTNITKLLFAQRGVLPAGETKPDNTDILIITGTDK